MAKHTVLDPSYTWEVVPWSLAERAGPGSREPAVRVRADEITARALCRSLAAASGGTAPFRAMLAEESLFAVPSAIEDEDVIAAVARGVATGRLVLLRRSRPRLVAFDRGEGAADEAPPSSRGAADEEALTWVEIELREHDGEPVPGEPYEIQTSDGRTLRGELDGSGFARVSEVRAGICVVTFPKRDRLDWDERAVRELGAEGEGGEARATWLEIELCDDDGSAVADELYEVWSGGRIVRRGRLDSGGSARVEGLAPGLFEVRFPGRDARDVVSSGAGSP